MGKDTDDDRAEWLTPAHAMAIIAPRLSRPNDARAIELILDNSAEGRIASQAKRAVIASRSETAIKEDCDISPSLWKAIRDNATYACWDTGDFDAQFHDAAHGWVTATFRGLRLARADIDALIPLPATASPKRRGRKPGSGGYGRADEPLLREMLQLISDGIAISPNDAARIVASKAKGATLESRQHRLAERFRKMEINGAK
jgi:hypothetical protein